MTDFVPITLIVPAHAPVIGPVYHCPAFRSALCAVEANVLNARAGKRLLYASVPRRRGYYARMKSAQELRRERRIGLIVSITVVSIAVIAWLTLKFVMGFSRVGANSMAPTIHRGDRVSINRAAYRFGRKPRVGATTTSI